MSVIRRVGVVGGTHGNEFTGAYLARRWAVDGSDVQRRGFETKVCFGNPRAFGEARRYIDRDLNRSFGPHAPNDELYEGRRARELTAELLTGVDASELALFDLHTTTSNMRATLIFVELGPFNAALAAWLQAQLSDVRTYLWAESDAKPTFLNALSTHGCSVEVGPVPNGVLRADALQLTEQVMLRALDFVSAWNDGDRFDDLELEYFSLVRHVDYPRSADGQPAAVVHPQLQDRDFAPLERGAPLFLGFDGSTVRYELEETLYPVFVNEAAYYEKGIAFSLTRRQSMKLADLPDPRR